MPSSPFELALKSKDSADALVVPPSWAQGRAAFGGLVAAYGIRACESLVPKDRPLRSLSVQFVGPLAPSLAASVTAQVLRAGKSMTSVHASIDQGGIVALITCAFGATRTTSLTLKSTPPRSRPPFSEYMELPFVEGISPTFTKHFEFRLASPEEIPFTAAKIAQLGGQIRFREPTTIDAAAIAGLVDAWPAPFLSMFRSPAPASTVHWQMDILTDLTTSTYAPEGLWRFESDGVAAAGGYGSITSRLWDAEDRLVAVSNQMIAEFSN
ncbi:MAG: thioesterase family protein [Polyangiaceae bacterium]|nr:thioesterase family protein [Polyangiaceae bacterium]